MTQNRTPEGLAWRRQQAMERRLSNPDFYKARDDAYRASHRKQINAYANRHYWEIKPRYMRKGEIIYLPKADEVQEEVSQGSPASWLHEVYKGYTAIDKFLLSLKIIENPIPNRKKFLLVDWHGRRTS